MTVARPAVDSALGQAAAVAVSLGAGIILAWAAFAVLRGGASATRRTVVRRRGADRPEWAPGIWMCASCRSSNRPTASRCERCRAPREELERPPVEPRPDWIPDRIPVEPGRIVSLRHEPAAHTDHAAAHWRLVVNGQTVGTAQLRPGAAALLRAIDGATTVELDVRGTGAATYALRDAIARFEAPRFPLDVPCPERSA